MYFFYEFLKLRLSVLIVDVNQTRSQVSAWRALIETATGERLELICKTSTSKSRRVVKF